MGSITQDDLEMQSEMGSNCSGFVVVLRWVIIRHTIIRTRDYLL